MAIEIKIKKDFGAFTLDFSYEGESRRLGILGASGSGKSMTLKCVAGIFEPDFGVIKIDGRTVFDSENKINLPPQKRNVGYLFQNYALFPNMSVLKNIEAGIKGSKKEKRQKALEIMEKFKLSEFEERLPSQLSGGQQQRVALARIIASEPEVILLDEPFAALDAYMKEKMQNSLNDMLKDFEGTVVTVSHSRDEIYTMSDELIVIEEGRVAACGKTADIFKKPPNFAAALLTGCKNMAEAEADERGEVFVKDWGVSFLIPEEISGQVKGAAIRAHDFSLEKIEGDMLEFGVFEPEIKEELFEYTVYFKAKKTAEKRLCFKVSAYMWKPEKDGLPQKLYLRKRDFLLLY